MKILTSLAAKVASIGQNVQFIAFWAHLGVAALLVEHSHSWKLSVAGGVIAVAAVKEFYFDAKFETIPPQTVIDNLQDFGGYLAGALLGLWL